MSFGKPIKRIGNPIDNPRLLLLQTVASVKEITAREGWADLPVYAWGGSAGGSFAAWLPYYLRTDVRCHCRPRQMEHRSVTCHSAGVASQRPCCEFSAASARSPSHGAPGHCVQPTLACLHACLACCHVRASSPWFPGLGDTTCAAALRVADASQGSVPPQGIMVQLKAVKPADLEGEVKDPKTGAPWAYPKVTAAARLPNSVPNFTAATTQAAHARWARCLALEACNSDLPLLLLHDA